MTHQGRGKAIREMFHQQLVHKNDEDAGADIARPGAQGRSDAGDERAAINGRLVRAISIPFKTKFDLAFHYLPAVRRSDGDPFQFNSSIAVLKHLRPPNQAHMPPNNWHRDHHQVRLTIKSARADPRRSGGHIRRFENGVSSLMRQGVLLFGLICQ
ncbi:hypothetical protein ACK3TF_004937 [Chlorella vulgaris]